jgi:hypothetical protein
MYSFRCPRPWRSGRETVNFPLRAKLAINRLTVRSDVPKSAANIERLGHARSFPPW